MNKPWTQEQYDERDRIMKEATDIPLAGSKPGLGYVGSRELVADLMANELYEWRKSMESIGKDIVNELLAKPPTTYDDLPGTIQFLIKFRRDYPHLDSNEIIEWITQAQDILKGLNE